MINAEMRHEISEMKTDIECLNMGLVFENNALIKSSIALIRQRLNEIEEVA